MIPVVYFPVKVISIAKYSRDQSISLTTVPAKADRRQEKRKGGGGSQVNSKQKSKFEEGFD